MSTRAELRATVLANIGNRTDKDDVINASLEDGLKRAVSIHFFKSLITETDVAIVADSTYASLPDNTYQLLEARLIDGTSSYPITIKSKRWLVKRWSNIGDAGTSKPVFGYVENDRLYLYPVSGGSYSIRMTTCINPSFDSADSTENPIPSLNIALTHFATAHVFRNIQLFDAALVWDAEFMRAFITAKSGDKKGPEVHQLQPFGQEVPSIIEPYLDPFAGHD